MYGASSSIVVFMLTPFARPVISRIRRLNRSKAFGAITRISNETMTPPLQLPVEFVEHEVTEQWRKWTPLRSPFHARADQPVLHHPSIQECPDEFTALPASARKSHSTVVPG